MADRTELEKMLRGEPYRASDPVLEEMRRRARRLTRAFNATAEDECDLRLRLLNELFGELGSGPEIEPPFYCDYGSHIQAGNGLYMNFGCVVLDVNEVRLGDNVLCGPYVQFLSAYHPVDPGERRTGVEMGAPISVGNNVWIGGGAIIAAGVSIGDDSVIGAGSVVVRDVPAGVLAAGNPCRVIKDLR